MKLFIRNAEVQHNQTPRSSSMPFFKKWGTRLLLVGSLVVISPTVSAQNVDYFERARAVAKCAEVANKIEETEGRELLGDYWYEFCGHIQHFKECYNMFKTPPHKIFETNASNYLEKVKRLPKPEEIETLAAYLLHGQGDPNEISKQLDGILEPEKLAENRKEITNYPTTRTGLIAGCGALSVDLILITIPIFAVILFLRFRKKIKEEENINPKSC